MAYADYTFYTDDFFGVAIAETDFPRLSLKASAVIDQITFNRAVAEITDPNLTAVKNAMCAVAEELQSQERNANVDGITSESQGQYSVAYGAGSNRTLTNIQKQQDAANVWLANTGLLFAGFYSGEYGGESDTE